ncbi:MAG: glycerophosphodiester phosphodiesterase family protein [Elusimicrobiota bacterium]
MKKIILASLLAANLSFAQSEAKKIEVHGHRGSRGTAPENTLAAFKEALKAGVDYLEFDLNMTSDGILVVSHDRFINKEICLGPKGEKIEKEIPIISLKLEELKKYDCGTLKNPKFPKQVPVPGERIPALSEVFELVVNSKEPSASKVKFNIETKIVPAETELSPSPLDFAKAFAEIVNKYKMADRTVAQSFDWRTLKEIRKIEPRIKLSQLTEANYIDPEVLALTKAEIISPWYKWITPEYVKIMKKAGKQVAPWTINDPKAWDMAVKSGVDAIITDYPAELIQWLKTQNLR